MDAMDGASNNTTNPTAGDPEAPTAGCDGGGDDSPDEDGRRSFVVSIYSHLIAAPPNWHQALIFFLSSSAAEDGTMRRSAPLLFGAAALMVLAQTMVAVGVAVGTVEKSCTSNDQCIAGKWCMESSADGEAEEGARCSYCGSDLPLPLQIDDTGGVWNHNIDDNFVGYNSSYAEEICARPVTSHIGIAPRAGTTDFAVPFSAVSVSNWCDSCFHALTGDVNSMTSIKLYAANLAAMKPFDWAALVFVATIVAFTLVGELHDICKSCPARVK